MPQISVCAHHKYTGSCQNCNLILFKAAAQLIKAGLDKKFGAAWHCVIGEGFGFDITYQAKNMIYIVYGTIGVLAYKC